MQPFPDRSKLQFLVGNDLDQICLGYWQTQFNFDKARISVEWTFDHVDKAGMARRHNSEEDRLAPLFLHHLLAQKVRSVEVEPFCLTIGFNGGDILRIWSYEGPYECGQIYDEDGRIMFVF